MNDKDNIKTIPLLGSDIDCIHMDMQSIDKTYRDKDLYAIKVQGDGMIPYVNDGDIALFYKFKDSESAVGDGRYIIQTKNGKKVETLKFLLNGNIRIISENPTYHIDEEVDGDDGSLEIIGKVVGRILKG